MQKSPYSLYKSCRQWSIEHFCEVWSLYLENFSRKIIFSAYWLQSNREMASKWVKMKFPELGVNRKVVGNVENYLNMKFHPKILTRSRENAKKPHFLTYFLIWLPSICKNRHTVFTKVVDNDPSNLYMNFQPNLATRSRENLQKPQKNTFLGIKGPKVFRVFSTFYAKKLVKSGQKLS